MEVAVHFDTAQWKAELILRPVSADEGTLLKLLGVLSSATVEYRPNQSYGDLILRLSKQTAPHAVHHDPKTTTTTTPTKEK